MTTPSTGGHDGPDTMPYGQPGGSEHAPGMPPGGNYPVEPNVVYHYADPGQATVAGAGEPAAAPAPAIPPDRPAKSANKADWETYAVACGATAETAHSTSKADLIAAYGDPREQ